MSSARTITTLGGRVAASATPETSERAKVARTARRIGAYLGLRADGAQGGTWSGPAPPRPLAPFGGGEGAELAGDLDQAVPHVAAHGGIGHRRVPGDQRRDEVGMERRRQRRPAAGDVEEPVQDEDVVDL